MVEAISYLIAALAFLGLGLALLFNRRPTGLRLSVVLASFLTALWAGGYACAAHYAWKGDFSFLPNSETIRTAGWLIVLLVLQRRSWGLQNKPKSILVVAAALGFVIALQIGIGTAVNGPALVESQDPPAQLLRITRMAAAIAGLVLLHNLYVGVSAQSGFSFRLLVVGLGMIFLYDLNLYTLKFLVGEINPTLTALRGAINALAAPLIYVSLRHESAGRFLLSRQAAFQTASFAVIGFYLILMSLIAYGLRLTGGSWGELLQIIFLAVTLALGAVILLSPTFRARLRVLIAINFYRYRYDYRVEWLRFIDTIDTAEGSQTPFRTRLVEAVATVVECPGGALLEMTPNEGFQLSATWQWDDCHIGEIPEEDPLLAFSTQSGRIINFEHFEKGESSKNQPAYLSFPDWAKNTPGLWLAIPLVRREELLALLLLRESLAPRPLNWEDYNLLRTLGRQGASYLAESAIQAELDEARSFEEYHRRFAFVMHDLKNLVSQISLLARNAERHADNPEFQADMVDTLQSSAGKMSDLLRMMGREAGNNPGTGAVSETVDLVDLLATVAAAARRGYANIKVEHAMDKLLVNGDIGRLEAMFAHLVQNAIDASSAGSPIKIILQAEPANAVVKVADEGHGMPASFIRDELFRPFRSTKTDGFGIGAFEAREIARAHGGNIQVSSTSGQGSVFSIILPLAGTKK